MGGTADGWLAYADADRAEEAFAPDGPTRAVDPLLAIMRFAREQLAPYKRRRRLEFGPLPKTISGKIRRVELRSEEHARHPDGAAPDGRAEHEFREEDFPELKA